METTLTHAQALAVLTTPGYDAYGSVRLYGVIGEPHESAGQLVAIKSVQNLDRMPYARIYSKTNAGVPVRRA